MCCRSHMHSRLAALTCKGLCLCSDVSVDSACRVVGRAWTHAHPLCLCSCGGDCSPCGGRLPLQEAPEKSKDAHNALKAEPSRSA